MKSHIKMKKNSDISCVVFEFRRSRIPPQANIIFLRVNQYVKERIIPKTRPTGFEKPSRSVEYYSGSRKNSSSMSCIVVFGCTHVSNT